MRERQKQGLPPVARDDAKVLILGSLPGEMSLRDSRYYAHPRNQFWSLLGNVIQCDLAALEYNERLAALCETGIALWDMVAVGRRKGSLDTALRIDALADVSGLIARLPDLRAIAFNGNKAAQLGARIMPLPNAARLVLPSSSPANTMPLTGKQTAWNAIGAFLVSSDP